MTPADAVFCELHLHIEGTLEPATVFRLAREQDVALPQEDEAALARLYDFENLESFLRIYYANMNVLRREQDFVELGRAYLTRAHRAGIAHAELFVDPRRMPCEESQKTRCFGA